MLCPAFRYTGIRTPPLRYTLQSGLGRKAGAAMGGSRACAKNYRPAASRNLELSGGCIRKLI